MHLKPGLLLKKLVLLGGLLLLTGCSLLNHIDETSPPFDPAQWPGIFGVWWFEIIEPSSMKAGRFDFFICQNGPEVAGFGPDTSIWGLVQLDGTFELLASSFIIGRSIKWVIWGNVKDNQYYGYYKPEETESFFKVKYLGHRFGPVPPQYCIEGFRGQAVHKTPQAYPLKALVGNSPDDAQPLDPSQWPAMAGEWQFSVIDPLTLKGRKFSIPICQLGPELSSAFVEDFMAGLIHLDGKFALIVHQYVGRKMSVWTFWGDLTKTELKGYYKPWNSDSFYAVKLQGHRVGPVKEQCPKGRGE